MNLKDIIKKLNDNGIPIPLIRLNGTASFTGTLALISFTTAVLGPIGKLTHFWGTIDMPEANSLFVACMSFHLGHKFVGVFNKDSSKIEEVKDENK